MTKQDDNFAEALEQLARGMHNVAHGHFNTKLSSQPNAPLADIFEDFNQMAESLLGVESLRESFVSNVAHEFKTPLAYIQGYATLLQDDDLSPERRHNYVMHINSAVRHLSDMIGNLLEISNLSRPSAELETSVFSLDEQLRHVLAIFIPQIERKKLVYEVNLETVDIEGNESLLEDAWINLVSNAVKYTRQDGLVSVGLHQEGEQAVVTVSDTGCGMSPNLMRHAFDRFYQGEDSHVSEGSGLGLAIVKAVVQKHHGSIEVDSKLYQGTTFTTRLPLSQPEPTS